MSSNLLEESKIGNKKIDPSKELREKELMNRVIKRIKLSSEGWKALQEDLKNKEPKNYIVRRFGIKPNDLKWLKKYLGY